jgi:EAL domain-containing protein (putative c-di-GMP-specific phosphodiesterase class I)
MALLRREAAEADKTPVFAEYGLAVMSGDESALNKAYDLAFRIIKTPQVVTFRGPGWLNRFRVWHMRLDHAERLGCRAAPLEESGRPDPWLSQPLDEMVTRLETPWFAQAISPPHLVSHLQPIMDMRSNRIIAHEALARSNALGEPVTGGQLVQAARAHGAMDDLERAAAITAAQAMSRIDEHGRLYVNMLPSTLACPTRLVAHLLRPFRQAGGDVSRTVIELVESEAMDPVLVRRGIDTIRAAGALAALDDVGSGHAAPALISELCPDVVKLDRTLLRLPDQGRAVLAALVKCSHSVGAVVVAEGVETSEDLEAVRDSGADYAQGWLIGRPAVQAARTPSFVAASESVEEVEL